MSQLVLSFLKNPWVPKVLIVLLAIALGAVLYAKCSGPRVTIVERPGATVDRTVYVDKPVLTEKIVTKYVTDKREVEKVMMANAYLENQVTTLNETIAKLSTGGGGNVVYVEKPGPTKTIREMTFKDWRLDFKAVDDKAVYTLAQKFEVITVVGKDKQGKPFTTTKVLEIGPNLERTPLENVQAVTVQANTKDGGAHWFFHGSLQGGFAGVTTTDDKPSQAYGGVVGLKWLTRGYTKSAEDGVYSLLTPVAFLAKDIQEFGIQPIGFNVGRIPKQPFRDLWISPLVTFNTKGFSRFGASISATF